MFAGVLLITGKQFSDCLTDCVKVNSFQTQLEGVSGMFKSSRGFAIF